MHSRSTQLSPPRSRCTVPAGRRLARSITLSLSLLYLLVCSLSSLGLTAAAFAAEPPQRPAVVDPRLSDLQDGKKSQIPSRLRGSVGGFQGRHKLDGKDALSLVLRTTASRQELETKGVKVRSLVGGIATVTVLPTALGELAKHPAVQSITLPAVLESQLDRAIPASGVDHLRNRTGLDFDGWTGAGVIVGVIDSGIDIDHPNFNDAFGNTRILYHWDMSVNDPTRFPAPYTIGTEWTAADIDAGLATSIAPNSHGTHVAAIAAGNGEALDENGAMSYIGVAPDAAIIAVKTSEGDQGSHPDDDIIDGLSYIFAKANALGLPAVINLSLGGHGGAHEGKSPLEVVIDTLVTAQSGRAVVVAAGNDGDGNHHFNGNIPASFYSFNIIKGGGLPRQGVGNDRFFVLGYYDESETYDVVLQHRITSSYPWTTLASLPMWTGPPRDRCTQSQTLWGNVVVCHTNGAQIGTGTARREYFVQVTDYVDATSGITYEPGGEYMIVVGKPGAGAGTDHDAWIFNQSPGWHFSSGSPASTVAIPAGSREAITVGAYSTKPCFTSLAGSLYAAGESHGQAATFSSRGPTADGRMKPDLSAPGSWVTSAVSGDSTQPPELTITNDYYIIPGTSMAAPMVTGAVALLLQEDPSYTSAELKTILRQSARQDDFTGEADVFSVATVGRPLGPDAYRKGPNHIFGYGKLDLATWLGPDAYETNDTLLQARKIVSGDPVAADLVDLDDVDFFTLPEVEPEDTVQVSFGSGSAEAELHVRRIHPLFNPTCDGWLTQPLASAWNLPWTTTEFLSTGVMTSADGIRVRNGNSAYTLDAVITRPEQEPNGGFSQARQLPNFKRMKVNGSVNNAIDRDFFRFTAYPGETLVFTRQNGNGKNVRLWSSSGTALASGTANLTFVVPAAFPVQPQTYFLSVAGLRGDYRYQIEVNP